MIWFGSIDIPLGKTADDAKEELQKIGVKVGPIRRGRTSSQIEFINCRVREEDMDKLDKLWGTFFWTLEPRKNMCFGCGSSGFEESHVGPDMCTFCDGTEGGACE